MAKNPKNKKRKIISTAEMLKLQSQLIKDHDAIPGKAGYLNWTPERAREWKTKQQLLLKEKQKLEIELKNSKEEEEEESSGVTPTMGLKAMGAAAAFGGDTEMTAATGVLAAGVGKKIFRGLFKKKNEKEEYQQEEEIPQGEVQKPKAPKRVRKPKSKIAKPGFLMSAEDKIRARAERINSEENASKGTPEKIEADGKSVSSDNSVIISILNKILGSFENDNERMRRSIRDAEEKKLESDPTPDTPGSPVKEGDDKKSGMNKLLMFGAIAGLLGLAYTFKDEIAKVLEPITDMLGITNPLKESDKEDYDFDIMDALGVTALMGMLGISAIPSKGVPPKVTGAPPKVSGAPPGAPEKPGFLKTQEERIRERGARINAERSAGAPVKKGLAAAKMVSRGLGPIAAVLGAYSLMNDLDEIEQEFKNGELTKEQYKEDYATAVGGFLGGSAGSVALASVGAILGAPVAGVGGIVGGVVGGVAGFFAGEAIGKYLGGTIGATMVGDPAPEIPKPKEFTEDDQNKLKDALKDEKIREKLSPGHLGILNKLANVNLKSGGLAARKAIKIGTETAGNAFADISKSESAKSSISSGGGSSGGAGASGDFSPAAPSSSGMPSASGSSGAPVASSPPPASETSGSAVTAATMNASEAQNSVTVLPPIVNNQSNTMKSGNEDASKAQKMTMQVRLNDDVFRKAVDSTAAVLKAA